MIAVATIGGHGAELLTGIKVYGRCPAKAAPLIGAGWDTSQRRLGDGLRDSPSSREMVGVAQKMSPPHPGSFGGRAVNAAGTGAFHLTIQFSF